MQTMKEVEKIEKSYLDTGDINNVEIMGLVRLIRVQNDLLQIADALEADALKNKVSVFRDGDGKIIATERTINTKGHCIFSKVVIGSMLIVTVVEFVQILSLLLRS